MIPSQKPGRDIAPRLGFISHVRGSHDSATLYRETIELAVHAEQCGFESFWLAQHHFGAQDCHLPSPLVLLAAIAERTENLRLGTAVVVGSLEDPIRLAEDAAVVDTVSGGRLELGLGSGADPATARRFGHDHERRHADFEANLDRLLEVLESDALTPHTAGLRDRLWLGTSSERGFSLAARRGLGVLSGRSSSPDGPKVDHAAAHVVRYRRAAAEAGAKPRVGMSRSALAAPSYDAAFAAIGTDIDAWVRTCHATGRLPSWFTARDYVDTGHVYLGTAPEVAERLAADRLYGLSTDLLLNTQPSAPPYAVVRDHLTRIGAESGRYAVTPSED